MSIAHMAELAVMPLQVLVDFFAPQGPARLHQGDDCKRVAEQRVQRATGPIPIKVGGSVFWARERLAQHAACTAPVQSLARPTSKPVSRVSRTGFAVGSGHGPTGAIDPKRFYPVRMRRSSDAPGDLGGNLAGRMVIAGRMRDVCAALNGLAD